MRKLLFVTAAFVAAVAVLVVLTLPPRRLVLKSLDDGAGPGILHVHTNRSDGLSGPDDIAAAAARAGLKFVVLTDHGDTTRTPDPPQYRSGVLCIDGVEISSTGGHYVAIDMPASPYPLGGEARDVVEDVHRLGGFGIAAHPDSPKPQLQWRGWDTPFDAIEIVNLDTGWRQWADRARGVSSIGVDASRPWSARWRILTALADYPFRPAETIGSLVSASGATAQWAALAASRRVVMLAGADAHSKLDLRADPAQNSYALPFPGYESTFKTMSVRVVPDRALNGDAAQDAGLVILALRAGHAYTALDSVASPPALQFTATSDRGSVQAGDELAAGGAVKLHVRTNAPPTFTTTIWNGANRLGAEHLEQDFTVSTQDPGAYRVEVRSPRSPDVAWLISNPIYVRGAAEHPQPPSRSSAHTSLAIFDGHSVVGWRVEHDPTSLAAVDPAPILGATELRFRFGLAGGALVGQDAALVLDIPGGVASSDRVTFTMRAEQPMRVSVQLRTGESESDRWARSVYIGTTDEEHTVSFDDMMAVGETRTPKPPLSQVRTLLFVVDTTNTKTGASGRLWMKSAALQR